MVPAGFQEENFFKAAPPHDLPRGKRVPGGSGPRPPAPKSMLGPPRSASDSGGHYWLTINARFNLSARPSPLRERGRTDKPPKMGVRRFPAGTARSGN